MNIPQPPPPGPRPYFCLLSLDAADHIIDAVRINKQEKLVLGSDQECDVILPHSPHPRLLSIRIRTTFFTIHPECGNEVKFQSHNQTFTSVHNDPSTVPFDDVFCVCGQRFKVALHRPERRVRVRRRAVPKKRQTPYPIPGDSVQLPPPKTVSKNDQEDKEKVVNQKRDTESSYKGNPAALWLSQQYIALFDVAAAFNLTAKGTKTTRTATSLPRVPVHSSTTTTNDDDDDDDDNKAINPDYLNRGEAEDEDEDSSFGTGVGDEDEDEDCYFETGVGDEDEDEGDPAFNSLTDFYHGPCALEPWQNKRIFLK
jgi:hypothetical protein